MGQPRIAIGKRKEARVNIEEVEASADALLKEELDRSMRKQKRKNPQFFGEYTSARMIIDLGTRHEKKNGGPDAGGSGSATATPPPKP